MVGAPPPPVGRGGGAGAAGPSAGLTRAFDAQEKLTRPAEAPRLHLSSGIVWDVGLDTLTPALPPHGESSDSEEDEKPEQATVPYLPGHHLFCRDPWAPMLCPSLGVSSGGWGCPRRGVIAEPQTALQAPGFHRRPLRV